MIPKGFRMFNRKYKVTRLPEERRGERHGDCDVLAAEIRLDPTNPREAMEHTFCHELCHAMLPTTTKPELTNDEDFVDSLGAALHHFLQTQKGTFD